MGVGLGLSLGPLSNLILSLASDEQQADASGVMNTTTNLGNSLGTAVIGVLLLVSVYAALGPAVEKAYPGHVTAQDVKAQLPAWVHTLETTNLQVAKTEQNTTTEIVNNTISAAMYTRSTASLFSCLPDFSVSLFIGRGGRKASAH